MTPTPDPTPIPAAPASAERMVLVPESALRAAGWRTLREWHEEAAGYGLAEFFFTMSGINPNEWAPPAAQPQPAPASSPSEQEEVGSELERARVREALEIEKGVYLVMSETSQAYRYDGLRQTRAEAEKLSAEIAAQEGDKLILTDVYALVRLPALALAAAGAGEGG